MVWRRVRAHPDERGTNGRDHNPRGFSVWLAGGGAKAGTVVGGTGDIGPRAADGKTHAHAAVLHLLGFNHQKAHVSAQRP